MKVWETRENEKAEKMEEKYSGEQKTAKKGSSLKKSKEKTMSNQSYLISFGDVEVKNSISCVVVNV